jgi:hypothetical protein
MAYQDPRKDDSTWREIGSGRLARTIQCKGHTKKRSTCQDDAKVICFEK